MFSLCQNQALHGIRILSSSRKATDNETLLVIFKERLYERNILTMYCHCLNSATREGENPGKRL